MKKHISILFSILFLIGFSGLFYSCSLEEDGPEGASGNPQVVAVTPAQAASNNVITLTGSGLGDIHSIVFEKDGIPAGFNPTLNTGGAIIFRVPDDAVPGDQNIILKNGAGVEFTVPFKVLGFANILSVSNYNFVAGDDITLTGKNLDDVSEVVLAGTTTTVTIKSKTATSLVITMPTTDANEVKLTITNAAGAATATQEFVNMDKAFKIFTDDYAPGYQDASWGAGGTISTTEFRSGTASVYKDYAAGNWHQLGFGWTATTYDNYKYLSFYIKGGTVDYDLYISTPSSPSGFASFDEFTKITAYANVWTYYKVPVSTLKLWGNNNAGAAWNQIGWRIKGPDGGDQRFYLDDVILIKN
jgi:hypothetical protein